MDYFKLPDLEISVSRFIFGTSIPSMMQNKDEYELLDTVYKSGINTFDTAHVYGESECSLGRWINERGLRDKVNVITKGCHHNKYRNRVTSYDMLSDIADSLKKLDTGYIDIYLLHRDDQTVPVSDIIPTLNKLKADGKIRCFGASNWTHQRIEEANEYAYKHNMSGFCVSSPCFSLAEQIDDRWGGGVNISGSSQKEAREWYKKNNMPVLAYSSLARGFFSGKYKTEHGKLLRDIYGDIDLNEYDYPENIERLRRAEKLAKEKNLTVAQVALAWILHHPMYAAPILSPTKLNHLESNLKAFDVKLTDEEFLWLNLGEE